MRRIFILLLALPLFINAQSSHSANELARENIMEYLSNKIFLNSIIHPVSVSGLESVKSNDKGIAWSMKYDMEVTELKPNRKDTSAVQQPYTFTFYLDKKLQVLLSERIQYSIK